MEVLKPQLNFKKSHKFLILVRMIKFMRKLEIGQDIKGNIGRKNIYFWRYFSILLKSNMRE